MKIRRLSVGVAVAAAAVVIFIIATFPDYGPDYQGRTLEEWSRDLLVPESHQRRKEARTAIATVGTNAIPWLVEALEREEPIWKKTVLAMVDWLPLARRKSLNRWVRPYEASEIRAAAAAGLGVLGPFAEPAIPVLVKSLGDPQHLVYNHALRTLTGIGSPALEALVDMLETVRPAHQVMILHAIRRMGTEGTPAASRVVQIVGNTLGSQEATAGISALSTMGQDAAPEVMKLVEDERYGVRSAGVGVMRNLFNNDHLLWDRLAAAFQLGGENEEKVIKALRAIWGNPGTIHPNLSSAVLYGSPTASEAAVFLMGEAARPSDRYARVLAKLADRNVPADQKVIEAALKKVNQRVQPGN